MTPQGPTGTGYLRAMYQHSSSTNAYSMLSLETSEISLAAYNTNGKLISRLWGNNDGTTLTAGTRRLDLYGGLISLHGGEIYTPGIPKAGEYATLVRSNGVISYLPSSRRYKIAEEPLENTVESFEDKLLSVDPKTWYMKDTAERYADHLTSVANGVEPERSIETIGRVRRMAGVIAEDLHDAGLGIFVAYDDEGRPDSVMHEGMVPAFIPIIRRLRDRVDALETKLGETA